MANDAHATIYGTVMQEPKQAKTSTNQAWLKMNVAVQTTKKDPAPKNPKYPYKSDYWNVNVYGKTAEFLVGKVNAGSRIMAIGDMYMGDPWQTNDGRTIISPAMAASKVVITGSVNMGSNNNNNNNNGYNNNNNYSNNNNGYAANYQASPMQEIPAENEMPF